MTIEEKLALLGEAEQFFSDLSDAWKETYKLWLRKAAALWTVKEGLELYKTKVLGDKEWTEEDLTKWLETVIRPEFISQMVEQYGIDGDELEFYMGWFGLAKWIMLDDKEQIDWFRKQQAAYDDLIQTDLGAKIM